MSIVVVSSDSREKGREIAAKAAESLGYRYLGRELLETVARRHDVPREKLEEALDESPSLLGMSSKVRGRYLALVQMAALGELLGDDVVCHGLAAHLYVLGVSHVLRMRILADPEEEARRVADEKQVSLEKARKQVERRKKSSRKWSLDNYRIDESDPSHYDLVVSLSQLGADEAVKIVVQTLGYRKFEPMTYSVKCLRDAELAARVRVALVESFGTVEVRADGGRVVVETHALKREKRKKAENVKEVAGKVSGVDFVEVHVSTDVLRKAAESFR